MAIQTRLVGTLGGAKVESRPVSAGPIASRTETMATVTVPAGQRWLVVVTGELTGGGTGTSAQVRLAIGTTESRLLAGTVSHVAEITGTATVQFITGTATAGFTGTLYTVKL